MVKKKNPQAFMRLRVDYLLIKALTYNLNSIKLPL